MAQQIITDVISNQSLMTLGTDSTVREASKIMGLKKISAILILEDENLIGIVTERDMTAKVLATKLDPDTTTLKTIMTADPDTLRPTDPPASALELMNSKGYRHLPILDEGKLKGIVSIRDLYSFFVHQLKEDLRQREAFMFDTGYGAGPN